MPNTFTSNSFASTYKDDFTDSAGYHRVLFNSGRALQARELNQIQSIIQRELSTFGGHVFKEGSPVNAGGVVVNNSYEFIKLDTTTNTLPALVAGVSPLVGVELTSTLGIKVVVLEVVPAEGSDPATLYVAYSDTTAGSAGASVIRVPPGDNLTGGGYTVTAQATNTTLNPAVGTGTRVSVAGGDYFTQGRFVFVAQQSIILSKYDSEPDGTFGYKVVQDIVTVSDTDTLYDNQGATPNIASPGADRYRIQLTLINEANKASDDNFITIGKVRNGKIVTQALNPDSIQYNKLNDVLSLRTKEESGDYIVKPFILTFADNDSDESKLNFNVSPGTAYIEGYRVSKTVETTLPISKPRTTTTRNNDVVAANYGNFFIVDGRGYEIATADSSQSNKGLPNIDTFEQINLRDDSNYGGSTIGTARVRSLDAENNNLINYHLFDFKMNSGQSERNIQSIGTSATNFFNIIPENNFAKRQAAADTILLFPLPQGRPQSISDISLTVQRRFTTTTNGSGAASLSLSASGETFADVDQWITGPSDSALDVSTSVSGAGTTSASISGATPGKSGYEVLGYVNKANASVRSKTLNETTETISVDSDGSGNAFYQLTKPDIFSFIRITETDSNGDDKSGIVITDDGQRGEFYDLGKLDVIKGNSAPSTMFVRYKYFSHGAAGDFFAVNSYTGQVNYADIPVFTTKSGAQYPLRDFLDFRSVVNSSGNFGAGAIINEVPRATDTIQFDGSYYLGKNAKLVASTTGEIKVVEGDASLDPKMPKSPDNSLDLYHIEMAPYVLSNKDIAMTRVPKKRYTMEDIGKLESRLESLEEATALTMLELATSSFIVLDEAGLSRNKAGFFVDNFANQSRASVTSIEYRAAIDPSRKLLRPSFADMAVRMKFESGNAETSNVIRVGDKIMLNYSEVSYISQTTMTSTVNVNPFAVVKGVGLLEISPHSDSWMETKYQADKVIPGDTLFETDQGQLWDNWSWNWTGNETVGTAIGSQSTTSTTWGRTTRGDVISQTTTTGRGVRDGNDMQVFTDTTTTTFETTQTGQRNVNTSTAVIKGFSTINELIGEREISRTLIPKMRSQKIMFKATGLKPNQRYFPFFGGIAVDNFVREETFSFISANDSDYSSGYETITAHPDTQSNLIADANGSIEGSFFLPSTNNLNFNTGEREFKLVNISKNDDFAATSFAKTNYTSQGTLQIKQRDILSHRVVHIGTEQSTTQTTVTRAGSNETAVTQSQRRIRVGDDDGGRPDNDRRDPIAQTFTVDGRYGVFITGVKLRFKAKSTQNIPVSVEIRPTVNGYPAADERVPGTMVFKAPSAVSISDDGSAVTTFAFPEPVYLNSGLEYAIVVISDSDEYLAYVARQEEFLLGSTEKRLNAQPSLGTLFLSQNSRTWEPDQRADLTFEIMRASFNTSGGVAVFENTNLPKTILGTNRLQTTNLSTSVVCLHSSHGFVVGDKVNFENAVAVGGISAANINGERTITAVDGVSFTFTAGGAATSTTTGGGQPKIERQFMYDVSMLKMDPIIPEGTLVGYQAKYMTGRSLAGSETAYIKDTNYSIVYPDTNTYFAAPRIMASKRNSDTNASGVKSATVRVDMNTVSNFVSPVFEAGRSQLALINNKIDHQASSPTTGRNVPTVFVAETDKSGGTHLAKHLTRPVSLATGAVGLKILLSANKPQAADFEVYYRTNALGALEEASYTEATPEVVPPSDENPSVFRDYRYLVGGRTGTLDEFTRFQIKIVMQSTNSSKVPMFKDLRVIALND